MAADDRERWNKRHAAREGEENPSPFLRQIFELGAWEIQPGRALDIAAGKGKNARFLAEKGFQVEAIDISEVALAEGRRLAEERGLSIAFRQADLEKVELPRAAYDMVINFNYLQRSLIPQIQGALKPGGYVVFETYLIDQQLLGHPRNPAHLLGRNELLRLFSDFRVLYYREGKFVESGGESWRAGLFGRKIY